MKPRHFRAKAPTKFIRNGKRSRSTKISSFRICSELELGDWARSGGKAAFVNMDGAGSTCDTLVEEIAPGGQLKPQRHMYEKAVFILEGQGATTIWNEGGKKHTLEWQKGSLFSTPLNTWHQHFNAQGKAPVRMVSLTRRAGDHQPLPQPRLHF